jgi:glycosyltransferase involved in cell wall biosynthesis
MESSGILALSKAESELIISRLPSVKSKIQILGYGLKLPDVNNELSSDVRSKLPAGDFLLFLGRISPGKGVETLLDYVERLRSQGMSDFSLVLAGVRQDIEIPSARHVVYLGKVSEVDKFALIKRAAAVVNPSSHESLSMVVIEAITCGVPVLVNSKSPVLHAYTETYETVFGFSDFQEFLQNVQKVRAWHIETNSQEVRKKLNESSTKAQVEFSWDGVISRFSNSLKR